MDNSIHSLKSSAISFLLLVGASTPFAHGAAVNSYASKCGYGYEHCSKGFDCVRDFNGKTFYIENSFQIDSEC